MMRNMSIKAIEPNDGVGTKTSAINTIAKTYEKTWHFYL